MRPLLAMLLLLAATAGAQSPAGPCAAPENAQFDFWLGTWEVHAQGRLAGHNTITRIHGGCTLLEEYTAAGGPYEGKSFNWYDPGAGRWHQVWVDNGGTRLNLAGGLVDGSMVLTGDRRVGDGSVADRITWTPHDDGTVRQHWEQSDDGGGTWTTLFDGLYRKVAE
jgi:hypothetical protein